MPLLVPYCPHPPCPPQPQAAAYSSAISACGRAGHLGKAVELKDEMLAAGLPMTHNIRLALLHTFAGGCAARGAVE